MRNLLIYSLLIAVLLLTQACKSDSETGTWTLQFEELSNWEGGAEYVLFVKRNGDPEFISVYTGGSARKLSAAEIKNAGLPKGTYEAICIEPMGPEDSKSYVFITGKAGAEQLFFQIRRDKEIHEILPDLLGDWVSYENGYQWRNFAFLYTVADDVNYSREYRIKDGRQIIIDDNPPEVFSIKTLSKEQLVLIDATGRELSYERPEPDSLGTEEDFEEGAPYYDYSSDFEHFKKAVLDNAPFDWDLFVSIEGQLGSDYKPLFEKPDVQFALRLTDYNNLPGRANEYGEATRAWVVSMVDENDEIVRPTFTFTETAKGLRLTGYSCCN